MPRKTQVESENLQAELLEDFARLSKEDLGDILAEGFEAQQQSLEFGIMRDLEEITGISVGEILSSAFEEPEEEPEGEFRERSIQEEETESEDLDFDNPNGGDTASYFDELFDDLDVDPDNEVDIYGDEGN